MAMEMMGQRVVTTGTCLFKKPNKMRLETVMDMGAMKLEQTQISNGKEVWTYQPKMNMANKIDMAKVGSAIPGAGGPGGGANDISKPFQGLRPDSIALVRTEDLEGKKAYVFAGVPGEPNLPKMPFDLAKVEVWIGADDGLVHRVTMLNTQGKEIMSRTYSNIQVNVEAADSLFEFTPPPGVQVMDMTEATLSMMKTMKGEPKPDKP
jgi:outer membrane lipoprotein-sorting protein